jgi:hypothetical protein
LGAAAYELRLQAIADLAVVIGEWRPEWDPRAWRPVAADQWLEAVDFFNAQTGAELLEKTDALLP